jgi:starch synthase (maltosyl-transferring)
VPVRSKTQPPPRILVQRPSPLVDCGRYPAKRCVGDTVTVRAEIVADGHEELRAVVRYRRNTSPGGRWREAPMRRIDAHIDGDTWEGSFAVDACGRWQYSIESWIDPLASWRHEVRRKLDGGQTDLEGELSEGALLVAASAERAKGKDATLLEAASATVSDSGRDQSERLDAALAADVVAAAERCPDRAAAGSLPEPVNLVVDRERARFSAWYELFPRSWGGLQGVRKVVPQIAELGFDILYFTPIHPIGETNRKGANNTLTAGPGDPGSVYAIGSPEGGHDAIAPELGTFADFDALVATCQEHGIEIALDIALQCSPDHPWLKEHPEWFFHRPDGTLKYAENPPKRYQDIYNVNFQSEDWRALWDAWLEIFRLWISHGVKAFRVDNPHTKPVAFWEWLTGQIHAEHPDVIFLSEAFTRRAMMRALAKAGFDQSYTYFTWKNSRWEIEEYLTELTTETADYFRPNFFANTPDILHAYLQQGGRPAFEARLVLASTLSPSYGIYSGFEHAENVPVREGSEEYLDSEKYELKSRALDGPLLPMAKALNSARRRHPALQRLVGLRFLDTQNDGLIAYAKVHEGDVVLCVVNLDPHNVQEGLVTVPADLGLPPVFGVRDVLDGSGYDWRLGGNYVRLEPGHRQAHVLEVWGTAERSEVVQ